MKKISLILTTFMITYMVSAQSPEKFSYQAVIRDGDGFLITESTIGMRVSILQGASPVYVETHTPTTDQNAMVYVEIGTGTSSDDFSDIDWANGIFFLKIETDILGGTNYTLVSTTQILSVPYALHAKSAETVTGTISENDPIYNGSAAAGISSGDVDNWDEAYSWGNHADAGYLQSFTESQILTISNDTIYLTGGSYVKLPAGFSGSWDDLSDVPANLTTIINNNFEGDYSDLTNVPTNVSAFTNDAGYITNPDDADADPTNELQIISISNDTIYLTNGGNVKLPAGFSGSWDDLSDIPSNLTTIINNNFEGDYSDLTNVPTNLSAFTNDAGYITNANDADADPSNELQIISISNDTIYMSNGGNVKLPEGFSGNYSDLTNTPDFTGWDTNVSDDFDSQFISIVNKPTTVDGYGITDAALKSEVQSGVLVFSNANGTADAYIVDLTPSITVYTTGMTIVFKANFNNSGPATLNVNSLGAKSIKKLVTMDLDANDIKNGQMTSVIYDGTNFQLLYGNSNSNIDYSTLPIVVTTDVIFSNNSNSALSGGQVISHGDSYVVERGLCWSTSPNPTVNDYKNICGEGIGQFTDTILNIISGNTYYIKAYAINSNGNIGYGNQITYLAYKIGAIFQGGIIAYIFVPGDNGYDPFVTHGLIAAPTDQSTGATWGCYNTNISGAEANGMMLGVQNTEDIVNGCGTAGIAARICYNLTLNGYSDWYLPSLAELIVLYSNKNLIGGFSTGVYLSSTEQDATVARVKDFSGGGIVAVDKTQSRYVRAIRFF